jgi:hypothetical protein
MKLGDCFRVVQLLKTGDGAGILSINDDSPAKRDFTLQRV